MNSIKTKRSISRITEMEEKFDSLQQSVRALEDAIAQSQDFRDNYKALKKYMDSGKWLKDYEADEKGELPPDLKRGVLSQDGLYDLLQDASDVIISLKGLTKRQ
ncbi:MAG: DUF4298 domain-containing protein [Bacteroidales bacterium]|nr:DUF4298 domain-containing protein [Bacteroidales bacterium]MBQ3983726.1 DUF4298 domain-containing protein [Bacteroidales bacterium]